MKKSKYINIPIDIIQLGDEGNHIFCNAKLNKRKVRVLIDTGASKSVISESLASELDGLKPMELEDNQTSGIGPEKVEANFVRAKSLSFKKLIIKKLTIGIIDLTHVVQLYEQLGIQPFDVILGGEVLTDYKAVIDYGNKTLSLRKKPKS